MMNQKSAVWYLANATRTCPIPLNPEGFRRKDRAPHDFVFFGHTSVRTYKRAGQWQFLDADVRQAGRRMAELPWNPEDLADLGRDERGESEPAAFVHTSWRKEIQRVIDSRGAGSGCGCSQLNAAASQSLHSSPDCLLQRYQNYTIACTLPVRTLVRADGTWRIPRVLAYLLDQRDEAERQLHLMQQSCDACGALSPDSSWRTPSATGWKVTCPACAAAHLRPYGHELQGVPYLQVRERGTRAADFLCAVCETARPATDWDHCHTHGLIRGPLCGSCNTMEGQGKEFLARPRSLQHLLRCNDCHTQRNLPPHHRLAALHRHLHLNWGVQGCDWPMHMCVRLKETGGGNYDCTVSCPGPRRRDVRSLRLTHEEAEHFLALTVEAGLTDAE
ncbi:endonuclease domain-containing protein [Streptomyces sp. NPDC055243]|uniref:endonuclease domain-containing protein n=1 Tax=Streptomyces sp. NPDC055243 TaxID=3365720 RepID=UPI0037D9650E